MDDLFGSAPSYLTEESSTPNLFEAPVAQENTTYSRDEAAAAGKTPGNLQTQQVLKAQAEAEAKARLIAEGQEEAKRRQRAFELQQKTEAAARLAAKAPTTSTVRPAVPPLAPVPAPASGGFVPSTPADMAEAAVLVAASPGGYELEAPATSGVPMWAWGLGVVGVAGGGYFAYRWWTNRKAS